MMLDLYHHGSSVCAAKVRLALAEKQLDWTGHYLDLLAGEQFNPEYLKINPKGVVPTLVHDGLVIPESTVICEYAEDVFPANPIFPRSSHARAMVRVWTKAVDEELHPACSALTYVVSHRHTILRNGTGSFAEFLKNAGGEGIAARTLKWQWIQQGLEAPGAAEKIRLYDRYLQKMESALEGRNWLIGDHYSMADIALAPYVNRLAMMGMTGMWDDGRLPRVDAWFAAVKARPSFQAALLDWVPADLTNDLASNGRKSWPQIKEILDA